MMRNDKLRETVAFLGVMASLVFVGWEIRQNTAVASGEARQTMAGLQQDWLLVMAQDTLLSNTFEKWTSSTPPELPPTESRRAERVMLAWIRQLEVIYVHYETGLADASVLDGYGIASDSFSGPLFREAWARWKGQFDPGFESFFEERTGVVARR